MVSILDEFTNSFSPSYENFEIDEPTQIDLEKNFQRYSFLEHHPEEEQAIDQLFRQTICDQNGNFVSVTTLLQASEWREEDLTALQGLGFNQLNSSPEVGIALEHPSFPGWLIKKNYGFQSEENHLRRIVKVVEGSDFPFWMLPVRLMRVSKDQSIHIQVPNDVINPLRVVMLKRGRQWIKRLGIQNIQAAKEYLYPLPGVDSQKPLHERVVVISKKADILSESDHLHLLAEMAEQRPEKLQEIANQIVMLIKYWKLTDAHLLNFRFLDDDTDTLIAIDGEPIGALADTSLPEMVKAIQAFDAGFYSLLGLKKLQTSLREQMEEEGIASSEIDKVQQIFDEKINATVDEIIWERAWHFMKVKVYSYFPQLETVGIAFHFLFTLFSRISSLKQ